MSTGAERRAAVERLSQPEEGQEDPFLVAYDEFKVALHHEQEMAAECAAIAARMPEAAKRNPRALMASQNIEGRTVPVYASSHVEIDEIMGRVQQVPGLDEHTDLVVINTVREAVHAALDRDAAWLEKQRVAYGLDIALARRQEAFEEKMAALDYMLSLTPITPDGCAWLARFVHAEANDLGPPDVIAKAAHNLARALSSMVHGDRFWPKPH